MCGYSFWIQRASSPRLKTVNQASKGGRWSTPVLDEAIVVQTTEQCAHSCYSCAYLNSTGGARSSQLSHSEEGALLEQLTYVNTAFNTADTALLDMRPEYMMWTALDDLCTRVELHPIDFEFVISSVTEARDSQYLFRCGDTKLRS